MLSDLLPRPTLQGLYAFVLTSLILSVPVLGTAGVGVYALLTCVIAFFERESLLANPRLKYLALFLGFGLLSVVWSTAPTYTLYYGAQIVLTALGAAILSSSGRPYDTLVGVTLALLLHTTLSHLFGKNVDWMGGKMVFVGLDLAKNNYGGVSALTVLLSLGTGYASMHRRQWVLSAIAVLGVALGAWGLVRSRAMGFTLSASACVIFILFMNVYSVLSARLRFAFTAYVGYALLCVGGAFFALKDTITAFIFAVTQKDSSLTGRTDIWAVAQDAINTHYWLGMGQSAFWVPGNPYAEKIWALGRITGKKGFTLHNTYIDLLATLGVVGLILYVCVLVVLVCLQFRELFIRPTAGQISWCSVLMFFLFLTGVEAFAPAPMNYAMFMLTIGQTFCATYSKAGVKLSLPQGRDAVAA